MFFRPVHRHGLFAVLSLLQLWVVTAVDDSPNPGPAELERSGISPFWSQAKKCIYFIDRNARTINRYDPYAQTYFSVKIETNTDELSFVIPVQDQGEWFAVGLGDAVGVVVWDGESNAPVVPKFRIPVPGLILAGKTDFYGKLWLAIGNTTDRVCVMESDGTVTTAISDISISKAISWGFDYKRFFYLDGNKIFALAADMQNKSLTTSWLVFDFDTMNSNISCTPIDLLVDKGGNAVVTCSNVGTFILEITPENSFDQIVLPTDNTTTAPPPNLISLVYAGLSRGALYATTAGAKPQLKFLNIVTSGGSGPEGKPVVLPSQWP